MKYCVTPPPSRGPYHGDGTGANAAVRTYVARRARIRLALAVGPTSNECRGRGRLGVQRQLHGCMGASMMGELVLHAQKLLVVSRDWHGCTSRPSCLLGSPGESPLSPLSLRQGPGGGVLYQTRQVIQRLLGSPTYIGTYEQPRRCCSTYNLRRVHHPESATMACYPPCPTPIFKHFPC